MVGCGGSVVVASMTSYFWLGARRGSILLLSGLLGMTTLVAAPAPNGYSVVAAFGGSRFQEPTQIVYAPGDTSRAFVVERQGRIAVISDSSRPRIVLDLAAVVNQGDD